MFERFTDRARRVVVLAQEEARMLNHNYIGTEHILLGLIHEGEGVAAKALESHEHLARGGAPAGRGDHRPGPGRSHRAHPVHPARQEGARALAPRGAAARPQLHRHRAHPARADPGGRGRRRPGAPEARRRPEPGPPDRDPAALRLHGGQGRDHARRRGPGRGRSAGFHGPGSVRPQPHAARPRAEARSGDRPREGDRARDAGPLAPHQEQPGADRRAGRRARPPWSRASARPSSRARCPRRSRASRSTRWTWAPWSPGRATAAISRSA